MNENTNTLPEIPHEEKEILALVVARKDPYRLALATTAYFTSPMYAETRTERLRHYLEMLGLSAEAPVIDHMATEEHEEYPAFICTGKDADWLWLEDWMLETCSLPTDQAILKILTICHYILSESKPAASCDPEEMMEALEDLEDRFGFLSRLYGPDGIFLVAVPDIVLDGNGMSVCNSIGFYGGHETRIMIFSTEDEDDSEELVRLIYESAVYALLRDREEEALPGEEELTLLEQTVEPNVRAMEHEDQVRLYEEALLLGLTYEGAYGEGWVFPNATDENCRAWQDYVGDLIRKFGEEVR